MTDCTTATETGAGAQGSESILTAVEGCADGPDTTHKHSRNESSARAHEKCTGSYKEAQ